jgi:hypothetical protein
MAKGGEGKHTTYNHDEGIIIHGISITIIGTTFTIPEIIKLFSVNAEFFQN